VCFVRILERTANSAIQNIKKLVFITEVESVYCAARTECLFNSYVSSSKGQDGHVIRMEKESIPTEVLNRKFHNTRSLGRPSRPGGCITYRNTGRRRRAKEREELEVLF
jgi:hypothetical protein